MKKVFADTGYWIALLDARDQLHNRALSVSQSLGAIQIHTSEMVLVELANAFSAGGPYLRDMVSQTIAALRTHKGISIHPQSSAQFQESLAFYSRHRDKDWSLTDCASILAARRESIQEVLSADEHFAQAGFTVLLQ